MIILSDERMLAHDPGQHHPERPDRLRVVTDALRPMEGLTWVVPPQAERAQLSRVHDEEYVAQIDRLAGKASLIDADTRLSGGSVEAAYLAAGAAVDAVERVVRGDDRHAFALVRPPGHHAESHTGMGFCVFNNIAVAAAHARAELGCERVLIVDWDVHHGNGTQHSFYQRDNVLFFSLHQYPFYPGTGALDEQGRGEGVGYTVNVPFDGGQGDGDYTTAMADLLVPIAERFEPDLVLVSAGFDAHRDDPLGGMRATEEGYASMTATVRDVAERHADGRLVMLLEGGYDLMALARSARACVSVLCGESAPDLSAPGSAGGRAISAVRRQHGARWGL